MSSFSLSGAGSDETYPTARRRLCETVIRIEGVDKKRRINQALSPA